jgi:ring-1,2-phenylacetyl-CoA epoxidase subunit PaaB
MSDRTQGVLWEVFLQEADAAPHVHAGSVHAPDREMALQSARDVYGRRGHLASIWVVESSAIASTTPSDRESFFETTGDKVYRTPQHFKVPRGVKGI